MKVELIRSEWTEDLMNEEVEKQRASEYVFHPVPPVTVTELIVNIPDTYNGYVKVTLSNGDIIEYNCVECNGPCGPDTQTRVTINGECVAGDEFLEYWGGSDAWVTDLLNLYETYQ
jgi:hypothetical protein